jgi:hypothetical protein
MTGRSVRITPPALHRTRFGEASRAVSKDQRVQGVGDVRRDNTGISADLQNSKATGQFHYERVDAVSDFLRGASARCIHAITEGVEDPNRYMDDSVRMTLAGLGFATALGERGVTFSLDYLQAWASGTIGASKPKWIDKIDTEDGQRFMSYRLPA